MLKLFTENFLGRYNSDRSGQFAVWFGVAAFPVLMATSMVLDFRSTEANSNSIKRALDVAVLAAVSNNSVDMAGKEDLAKDIFNTHYSGTVDLELDVKVSDRRVEMNAQGLNSATLSRAVGNKGFSVNETSIAEMTRQNTICVMALAEEGAGKVRFLGATKFNSPTCSVQSNSQDPNGILSDSRFTPIAKSFCSAGGAKGDFNPAIRGECRVIDDPHTERDVPDSGICMPDAVFETSDVESADIVPVVNAHAAALAYGHSGVKITYRSKDNWHKHEHCHTDPQMINRKRRCHKAFHPPTTHLHAELQTRLEGLGVSASEVRRLMNDYDVTKLIVPESTNYIGTNKIVYPGTYCGGLTVNGANVTFMPGTYIMKDGPLTFKNGASVFADEVSFILKGETSAMTVESGSYVDIKAPRTGAMAGMAIYQDKNGDTAAPSTGAPVRMARSMSVMSSGGGATQPTGAGSGMPTAVNLISSGGELNVTGTMYFPTQALEVLGQGILGAKAPATSFIAHEVTFADESQASVSVNHVQGRIPPMVPLSDDGARLVK